MPENLKIVELMRVPEGDHDLDWLKASLQAAIELEFATLPLYLSARWSVKDAADPVSRAIRSITMDEMSHMGFACNMLSSIGGRLKLNVADVVPTYPGPLPGGVHPGLTAATRFCNGRATWVITRKQQALPTRAT